MKRTTVLSCDYLALFKQPFQVVSQMPADDYGVVGARNLGCDPMGCQVHLVSDDAGRLQEAFKPYVGQSIR